MNTWLTDADAFASLFRSFPNGLAAVDRNGDFVACNAAFARITGYEERSIAGQSIYEIDRVGFRAFAREAFDAAGRGQLLERDVEFAASDASTQWYAAAGIPVGGSSNVHVFLSLRESTSRNEAENPNAAAEIGQLRANFRLLFDHNPAVVISVDRELHITDVNPAGLRTSGYAREQLVDQNVLAFVPPSNRDRLRMFLRQALGGATVTFPIDAYAADRRLIQYEATALPIISQNIVVGVYGLLENVTDRVRAERTVAAQREELIDLETDFHTLFDHNPDGIILFSITGEILDVNEAALTAARRSREDMAGRHFSEFVQNQDVERITEFFRRVRDGEIIRYEITTLRPDGSPLINDITLFAKYAQGVAVAIYCVTQDITQRRESDQKWKLQAQRIRDLYLLATAPEYTDGQVMATLQAGCRLLTIESGAIVDASDGLKIEMRYDSQDAFSIDDQAALALAAEVLRRHEPVAAYAGDAGEHGCGSWIGTRLMVGGTLHGVLIFFSRTRRRSNFEDADLDTLALMSALFGSALERRRTRSSLRTLAYFDSLTSLPNRTFFHERLRDALLDSRGRPRPVAVLYFDLDRFKDINDTLGHAMGDRLLQLVAERLVQSVGDGIVARMGGDEFAVLLPGCESTGQVHALATQLLETIERPYQLDDFEQFVTTSIGISVYPENGRDDQTLIKNADIAMYEVKEHGGNGYFFYNDSLETPIQTRLAQEKLLRRAIEKEQFTLHYQPIVDVASGKITGVEALVRWNDPLRGLVFPDEFIPTAEATGLIVRLGDWILTTATAQIRQWRDRFDPLTLAVNLSARQFQQPNLSRRLQEIVNDADLDPGSIEIEITESMEIWDVSHAVETVQKIKQLGVRIGVDDFGTGHSSLNYLRRFEVDHIKIDRTFVAGIGSQTSDETIVKAIVAMGHSLGLKIVAEGVETSGQLEFLRLHGCDRAQGYLFSQPLDAAAMEALLNAQRGSPPKAG